MTRDEAVAIAKTLSSFRTSGDDTIVTFMQSAQELLEAGPFLPWFLKSERSYISTSIGEERLPIPTDFLREDEDSGALWYVPDDTTLAEVELVKDDMDYLRKNYPGTGRPTHYALDGEYYRLFPAPDAVYTIKHIYMKKDTVLNSNVENGWLKHAHMAIIGRAGTLFSMSIRDQDGERIFKEIEGNAMQTLHVQDEARQHTSRRYQMGGAT